MLEFANAALVATLHHLGEFTAAGECFEACRRYYRPRQSLPSHFSNYFLAAGEWARVLWFLGYPDRALQQAREGCDLATSQSNPFHASFSLQFLAYIYAMRREPAAGQKTAEEVFAISRASDVGDSLFWASIPHGWAIALQGRHEEGIAELRESLAGYRSSGAEIGLPQFHALMAYALMSAGRLDEALDAVDEVLELARDNGDAYYNAELRRLHGELLLQTGAAEAEAEACFQDAIEVAKQQSARSWELRAATSLARLWQQQGKIVEAGQMLAEIYGWFTEGFDTADLKDAKTLLDELQS